MVQVCFSHSGKTAIGTTKQILDETKRHEPEVEQWKADYYAALAVKACLRVREYDSAKQILSRGLQLEPHSAELGYLSRILAKESAVDNSPKMQCRFRNNQCRSILKMLYSS